MQIKEALKILPSLFEDFVPNIQQLDLYIIKLDKNAMRELLKETDKNNLMIALKGATDELKQKFLENMSQRASEAFLEELQYLGPVKVKDVEAAQRRIIEIIQKLAEEGKISIGAEEEVIE